MFFITSIDSSVSSLDEEEKREEISNPTLNPTFRFRGQSACFFREYKHLRGNGTNLFDFILKYKPRFKNSEQVVITVDLKHLSPACVSEKVIKFFCLSHKINSPYIADDLSDQELAALAELADYASDEKSKIVAKKQLANRSEVRPTFFPVRELLRRPPASSSRRHVQVLRSRSPVDD